MKFLCVVVLPMALLCGCASTNSFVGVQTVAISPDIPKTYGMISPNSANVPDLGDAAIDQILLDAFSTEIKTGGGLLTLGKPGAADATMHLKLFDYGLIRKRGGVGPFVTVKATIINNDGHVIYRSPDEYVTAPRQTWRTIEEYSASDAVALRQGLHDAAAEAAREIDADLGDVMKH